VNTCPGLQVQQIGVRLSQALPKDCGAVNGAVPAAQDLADRLLQGRDDLGALSVRVAMLAGHAESISNRKECRS